MSASSSGSTSTVRPLFRKINDSLNEFHSPSGGQHPTAEIIFFHGLHLGASEDAFWKTWTTSEDDCWPQTWLAQELPSARILSVAYDASVNQSNKRGRMEFHNIGENLVRDVICSDSADVSSNRCPIILVAHSLGGLVVKKMILEAEKELHQADPHPRLKPFLDNLRGIFYFSTPNSGAHITNFTSYFSYRSPVTSALEIFSAQGAILNEDFRKWRAKHRVAAYAAVESEMTLVNGYFGLVVQEASARYDVDRFYKCQADHFTVCTPGNPSTDSATQLLVSLVKSAGYRAEHDYHPENFQHVPKYIVGIDRLVVEIEDKLTESTSLGLVGMGGVGKTTLAKAVFNALGSRYEYTCFIDEVKKIQGGVEAVKEAVLKHVRHWGKKIQSVDDGLNLLQGKRLFLVLDDAASEDRDLKILSILQDDIGIDKGSRFVVTSRDGEVVTGLDEYYPVPFLDTDSSTSLLTALAFGNKQPPALLQEHVDVVVTKCEGLPLTLEVLGKYLRKKGEKLWWQAAEALQKADDVARFDEKLWAKLRVSYNGLHKDEKEIFLDAATVFLGRLLSDAKQFWSSLYGYDELRWQRLVDLSLVTEFEIEEGVHLIRMHEQLLSMGRKIALTSGENGKCSRVYNSRRAMELVSAAENSSCSDDMEDIVAFQLLYGMPVLEDGDLNLYQVLQSTRRPEVNFEELFQSDAYPFHSYADLVLTELPRTNEYDLRYDMRANREEWLIGMSKMAAKGNTDCG